MSWTLPALLCKMGNTEYYITSMKAGELVNSVTIPKDMEGWNNLSIDEIYQRDIQYSRVRTQIVPYLANNEERFFGSLIVAAQSFESIEFQQLTVADTKFRASPSVKEAANMIGFLTIPGGVTLVPLDGQHRLAALKFAISGKDEKERDIEGINSNPALAGEDVCVIIMRYDGTRARRIFTNVNRYARKPSSGQVIITDDDDPCAIIARSVANKIIGGRLVRFSGGNTLGASAPHFTTLATVYNCCATIILGSFPVNHPRDIKTKVSDDLIELWTSVVEKVWGRLCVDINIFADALTNREEDGDKLRAEIRKRNLLGKPAVQDCLVRAYMTLRSPPTNLSHKTACEKLNLIPWEITPENISQVWLNVLWGGGVGGKIIPKEPNRKIASRLIAYMAGEVMSLESRDSLLSDIRNLFPESQRADRKLPDLVG